MCRCVCVHRSQSQERLFTLSFERILDFPLELVDSAVLADRWAPGSAVPASYLHAIVLFPTIVVCLLLVSSRRADSGPGAFVNEWKYLLHPHFWFYNVLSPWRSRGNSEARLPFANTQNPVPGCRWWPKPYLSHREYWRGGQLRAMMYVGILQSQGLPIEVDLLVCPRIFCEVQEYDIKQ